MPLLDRGRLMANKRSFTDYGGWVRKRLQEHDVTVSDLSRETRIQWPSLNRILKSGESGEPVRPNVDTIEKINKALVRLDVIKDEDEGWVAAGVIVEGWSIRKEGHAQQPHDNFPGLPENYEEWPEELKRALAYSGTLSPEAQKYVYQLWRSQAEAHAKISDELRRLQEEAEQLKNQQPNREKDINSSD